MIRHYLVSALVNIGRTPITTAAKVLTLALGLAAMITVTGIVSYWRSSDSEITPPGGRVMMFTRSLSSESQRLHERPTPTTQMFLAKYLREDIPEFEAIARYQPRGRIPASSGERTVILNSAKADPELLDIFKLDFVAGDPAAALQREDGVILSRQAAEHLFGTAPALGRRVTLAGKRNAIVTGVIGPIREPSLFAIAEMGGAVDCIEVLPAAHEAPERWTSFSVLTFGLLPARGGLARADIDRRLAGLIERRMPADLKQEVKFKLGVERAERLTELRLDSVLFGNAGSGLSVANVFFGLGLIVLAAACLNYANLAAAQTLSSTALIGMRRILGAGRAGILLQSWIEAGLTTLAALAAATALLWLAAPVLFAQAGIDLFRALSRDPPALAAIMATAGAVTVLAGLFPAFIASRLRPAEALRSGRARGAPRGLAAVLVGLQFASASMLLIAVIVVGQQNEHMKNLTLERGGDPVVVLPKGAISGVPVETFRRRLAGHPEIRAVSEVRFEPWDGSENSTQVNTSPEAPGGPNVSVLPVGFDYFEVYGQAVLAGRVFDQDLDFNDPRAQPDSKAQQTAPDGVVIDRTYAEQLGFASPQAAIGQLLYYSSVDVPNARGPRYEIIGVVESRPYAIQTNTDGGTMFDLAANAPDNTPLIRVAAGGLEGGLAAIRKTWSELAPDGAPGYRFEDDLFEQSFRAFERVGQLFAALSLLAFLISSTGLLGMALQAAQRRMHEIGVRKILGSNPQGIIALLLADFSKPVIAANLLAWPLAYFGAQTYLSVFAHRIELSPAPFLLSLLITLAIAWAAVIGVALKAANVRPAQVLRHA